MGHISFVILNYKAYQESIDCADSILNTQNFDNYSIVIVDNGSKNGSDDKLKSYFEQESRVHVIVSEKNLGFACGNNLGISYARKHFDPDFIVAANSDIIFEQKNFCEEIAGIYRKHRFALLGGDIVDISRTQHFNPVARNRVYSIGYMRKQVFVSWSKAVLFRLIKFFHLKKWALRRYGIVTDEKGREVKEGSKNLTTREVNGVSVAADSRIDREMSDVLLHGCCIIFSRDFFCRSEGFYEKTFLYAEEEILYYLARKMGMTILYSPRIGCIHKEAVSTNSLHDNFCDAKIFYFSNITKSYRIFLELMKQMEK